MTKTVDNPQNILKAINFPKLQIETDEDSNIVELGIELTNLAKGYGIRLGRLFSS